MPDEFTGEETWSDWLNHFELCASINKWDDQRKVSFLAVRLKKAAQQAYRDLPSTVKQDYDSLKHTMTMRFDNTKCTDLYKSELKYVKREQGQVSTV